MAQSKDNLSDQIQSKARELADQIVIEQEEIQNLTKNGKVYTRFDRQNDIVENQKQIVTDGIWSNSAGSLSTFFTSSSETSTQKKYYYEIYQSASSEPSSEAQFSIAYGNYYGSGSAIVNYDYPTRAIYDQYKMLLTENEKFNIDGSEEDNIYVININRSRYKDKLDEGNVQLAIAVLNGAADGSSIAVAAGDSIIQLIDDSSITEDITISSKAGVVYNMVSGSINAGVHNPSAPVTYGKFYPDLGMILLSGGVLDTNAGFNTITTSDVSTAHNNNRLFTAISGAAAINTTNGSFYARNEESLTSTHYFVRVKNAEYNYSNNPSFTTGSYGAFRIPTFINNPKTYVTTVGLYNDRQELLAIAKLSQPIIKSFYNELLIKVKLEF